MMAGMDPRQPDITPLRTSTIPGMTTANAQPARYQEETSDSDSADKISVESIIEDYKNGEPTSVKDVRKWMKGVLGIIKSEEEQLFD